MTSHTDMNGLWSGSYSYNGVNRIVRFTAWFDETDGILIGSTLEPNTFAPGAPDELTAELSGERPMGQELFFHKTYTAPGIIQPPLLYVGEVDADFTHVKGGWRFSGANMLNGLFELTRLTGAVANAAKNAATEPVA